MVVGAPPQMHRRGDRARIEAPRIGEDAVLVDRTVRLPKGLGDHRGVGDRRPPCHLTVDRTQIPGARLGEALRCPSRHGAHRPERGTGPCRMPTGQLRESLVEPAERGEVDRIVEWRTSGQDDRRVDAIRERVRETQRVLTAHRPPDRREPVDADRVRELADVVGPIEHGASGPAVRAADTGSIRGHDADALRQRRFVRRRDVEPTHQPAVAVQQRASAGIAEHGVHDRSTVPKAHGGVIGGAHPPHASYRPSSCRGSRTARAGACATRADRLAVEVAGVERSRARSARCRGRRRSSAANRRPRRGRRGSGANTASPASPSVAVVVFDEAPVSRS